MDVDLIIRREAVDLIPHNWLYAIALETMLHHLKERFE